MLRLALLTLAGACLYQAHGTPLSGAWPHLVGAILLIALAGLYAGLRANQE